MEWHGMGSWTGSGAGEWNGEMVSAFGVGATSFCERLVPRGDAEIRSERAVL